MELRKLTVSDVPSLLELYRQLHENDERISVEQSIKVWEKIEKNPNIEYFGAVENGKVLSSCYVVYIPNLTKGNRGICFVENVVTDREYRKHGLASQLIDMAIEFAKEHNCYKAILQSGMYRKEAHQFYEHKGFDGSSKRAFHMLLK